MILKGKLHCDCCEDEIFDNEQYSECEHCEAEICQKCGFKCNYLYCIECGADEWKIDKRR
jgi:hypothetical protein